MKKQILVLLVSFCLFNLNAQTLEHTYSVQSDTSITYTVSEVYETISPGKVSNYCIVDSRNNTVKIYNLDHSFYKTVSVSPPAGYKIQNILNPSKYLFDNDPDIEFLVTFNDANSHFVMKLYDENGTVVYNFGACYFGYVFVDTNNKFKLRTYAYPMIWHPATSTYTYDYTNSYYLLDGTVPASFRSAKIEDKVYPYPNPSNTIINLPYNLNPGETAVMSIYNVSGLLLDRKTIDSNFHSILLDVSSYQKGVYLYQYNDISSSFIVN